MYSGYPASQQSQLSQQFLTGFDKIPVIVGGDFNTDFSQESSSQIVDFLKENYDLIPKNSFKEPTTRGGTCIDAIFSRNIQFLECEIYTSYFSYHKPIVAVVKNKQ